MPIKLQLPPLADERVFEDFVLDLFNINYPDRNFQLFGKKGNRQKDIDIISTQTGIAIQCELKEHTRKGLVKELERDFKSDIEKIAHLPYIIVSTFGDNTQLVEYLQVLKQQMNLTFDVTYIGWQSLSAKVQSFYPSGKNLPPIFQKAGNHTYAHSFFRYSSIGRMQLVETTAHSQTGHTGGFSLWNYLKFQ